MEPQLGDRSVCLRCACCMRNTRMEHPLRYAVRVCCLPRCASLIVRSTRTPSLGCTGYCALCVLPVYCFVCVLLLWICVYVWWNWYLRLPCCVTASVLVPGLCTALLIQYLGVELCVYSVVYSLRVLPLYICLDPFLPACVYVRMCVCCTLGFPGMAFDS